jgi:hypothetical protein
MGKKEYSPHLDDHPTSLCSMVRLWQHATLMPQQIGELNWRHDTKVASLKAILPMRGVQYSSSLLKSMMNDPLFHAQDICFSTISKVYTEQNINRLPFHDLWCCISQNEPLFSRWSVLRGLSMVSKSPLKYINFTLITSTLFD